MAHAIHGKGAIIYLAGTNAGSAEPIGQQISWSLDFDMAIVDTSPLLSSWKEFVKGMKGWTGTFAGNFDIGSNTLWTASLEDNFVNFYLYPNGANNMSQYYYGTCWVQLGKIAEGSTTTKASSGFKVTGDGALSKNP
jgi:hypothetical protein